MKTSTQYILTAVRAIDLCHDRGVRLGPDLIAAASAGSTRRRASSASSSAAA